MLVEVEHLTKHFGTFRAVDDVSFFVRAGEIVFNAPTSHNPVFFGAENLRDRSFYEKTGMPVAKDKHGHIVVEGSMRCRSHPEVWALGDCASIPAADGKSYPNLAQHALREAKVLARNIFGALNGRPPQPFVYTTLGMMGSLGHGKAFGQMLGVRVRGVLAWLARRTYYLLQMPRWERRFRIVLDWTVALFFAPDAVKLDMGGEGRSGQKSWPQMNTDEHR